MLNGYYVTVQPDGSPNDFGCNILFDKAFSSPAGRVFAGCVIPWYGEMVRIAGAAHERLLKHRFIAWDFAADKNGEAVLIEYNFKGIDIYDYEILSGPLFGDMLEDILIETAAKRDNYYVESPYFEGYRASKSVVSGMMYAKDLTVTVLYSSRGIIIVDNFDVPRGASSQSLTCGDCVE